MVSIDQPENRQKRGDVEILNYLQDAAGSRNLVFDLAVTHDRYGSSAQPHHNGLLTHPRDRTAARCCTQENQHIPRSIR